MMVYLYKSFSYRYLQRKLIENEGQNLMPVFFHCTLYSCSTQRSSGALKRVLVLETTLSFLVHKKANKNEDIFFISSQKSRKGSQDFMMSSSFQG